MESVQRDEEGDVTPRDIPPVPEGEGRDLVPENIPPVTEGEGWDNILKAVHQDAHHEEGHWHDAEDDAQRAIEIGLSKYDQFDPGRGASRTTLVKAYRRNEAVRRRRRRARQSTLPLHGFDCPSGVQSGEYEAIYRDWRSTVAVAANNTYSSPETGPVVRKAIVLTIAGEDQKSIASRLRTTRANHIATHLFEHRGRVATPLLEGFHKHFEEEMKRLAIGGPIRLDGLYFYCAEQDQEEAKVSKDSIDVSRFRYRGDSIDVTFERVPRDVDRLLELIAADVAMPMFVRDVVVNRLEAISDIASGHSGVIPARTDVIPARTDLPKAEFDIARLAVRLVFCRFPYFFADVPSLASFAGWVGFDVAHD
jgi:hypothetical protein